MKPYSQGYREAILNRRRDAEIVNAIMQDLGHRTGGYIDPVECYPTLRHQNIRPDDYEIILQRLAPTLEKRGIYLWMTA